MPQGPVDLGFGTTEESFSTPRNRTLAVKQHGLEKCIALLGNKKRISRRISFLITRERDGCHKVQWTLALARPRGALASREIVPKLPNSWVSRSTRTSRITKKDFPFGSPFCYLRERETGIEPATPSLARRCSTTEPLAQTRYIIYEKI